MIQAIVFLPLIGAVLRRPDRHIRCACAQSSGDEVEHHGDAHGADAHASMPMTIIPTITAMTIMPSSGAAGSRAAELITPGCC